MITQRQIDEAVATIASAARPERIVLFGSHARGDANDDSDLDLLVIERQVENRGSEMVRLRRALRPMRIPVDILVASSEEARELGSEPGNVIYWALKEGRAVYG
jgi:predicted nucleotidyltransferase